MIYITAIHLDGGTGHEHVTKVRWLNGTTGKAETISRAAMVDFIAKDKNTVQVGGSDGPVPVGWSSLTTASTTCGLTTTKRGATTIFSPSRGSERTIATGSGRRSDATQGRASSH